MSLSSLPRQVRRLVSVTRERSPCGPGRRRAEGERDFESVEVDGLKALPGVIAGTHVLLIRR